MKSSSEDINSVKKKLTIEVESQEVDRKFEYAYRELSKRAKVPGFRAGKIPRNILERRFGNEVTQDVARDIINDSLPKAFEELDTMPLGAPILDTEPLKPGADFKYSATIEVRPQFELNNYLGIEVEKEKLSITDKEVSDRIEEIRKGNGTLKTIEPERSIQKEDYTVLDYEVFENDKSLDDLKATNFLLRVGDNHFHPQFEKDLIGLKKDNEKEIHVEFEDNHRNPKFAGKSLMFKVKIVDIKEMVLPELNDDFAKGLGADFNNMEDLRQKLKEMLIDQEEKRIDNELKQRLTAKIMDSVDFEYPQILVESDLNQAFESFKQSLAQNGSSLEQAGITEEKFRADFRPASEKRVKEMLILDKIAIKDGITLDEEDLKAAYEEQATGMGLTPEVVRQYFEARGLVESLKERLLAGKTLNYLVNNAKLLEVERDVLSDNVNSEKENN